MYVFEAGTDCIIIWIFVSFNVYFLEKMYFCCLNKIWLRFSGDEQCHLMYGPRWTLYTGPVNGKETNVCKGSNEQSLAICITEKKSYSWLSKGTEIDFNVNFCIGIWCRNGNNLKSPNAAALQVRKIKERSIINIEWVRNFVPTESLSNDSFSVLLLVKV